MLVIKNTVIAKCWREISRLFRSFNLMAALSQLAILVTLVGFVTGNISEGAQYALYCLTALAILLMSHYARKYFQEVSNANVKSKAYEKIHRCSEKIRELNILTTQFYNTKPKDRGKIVGEYLSKFAEKCDAICCDIKEALNAIGYDVNAVCIKSINLNSRTLNTIARCTDSRKNNTTRDESEPISNNPFAKLLIETHANYDRHITHPELRKINRNRHVKNMPKFLAIGTIDSRQMPSALVPILHGYANSTNAGVETVVEIEPLMQSFRERAEGKYNACMGVMIAKKMAARKNSASDHVFVEQVHGFVGLDSQDGNVWNFLDFNDVHLVAAVADSLYHPMTLYSAAKRNYA